MGAKQSRRTRLDGERAKFAQIKIAAAKQRLDEMRQYYLGILREADVQRAAEELEIEKTRLATLEAAEKKQ